MAQFENKQKISTIIFKPKSACHNLCPLGQLYCDELAKDGSKPTDSCGGAYRLIK